MSIQWPFSGLLVAQFVDIDVQELPMNPGRVRDMNLLPGRIFPGNSARKYIVDDSSFGIDRAKGAPTR